MAQFTEFKPRREDYWRSIILFGRNVASYKFALGKSLLEFRDRADDLVKLEDLAKPFARHLAAHVAQNPKQATSSSSKFLDACRSFNEGLVAEEELYQITKRIGFNNVIDAFHVVNGDDIPNRFFIDERSANGGIRLTDELHLLLDGGHAETLSAEVEARWRLVETAWDLGVSRNLISVGYDPSLEVLYTSKTGRRVDVTSCRDALNGYQKGKCFHCFSDISVSQGDSNLGDVDHFIPHTVKAALSDFPVDGVWNLVLACRACNRGAEGKFAKMPSLALLQRLYRRNEFLIASHHPLRETLIRQTGATTEKRRLFLQTRYDDALALLIHVWEPEMRGEQLF